MVADQRSFSMNINEGGQAIPRKVVDVRVYLAERKLDVCDEQVEHGGTFWPQTMKVSNPTVTPRTSPGEPVATGRTSLGVYGNLQEREEKRGGFRV